MAITFPSSPNSGDTFTSGGRSWQYNGTAWVGYGNLPDPSVFAVDATNDTVTVTGDISVSGDFTVSGTTTTINTTDLNVQDNVITLNYGVTGTPTLDAGIEVERGDLANTSITWDESEESWVVGGTAYVDTANGRVGIGTTSPSQELDVNGDIVMSVGNGIMFDRSGSDVHVLYKETPTSTTYGTGDDVVLRNPNGADILFQTNGSNTRMTIDSSGDAKVHGSFYLTGIASVPVGEWQSYTPSVLQNSSVGNGSTTGYYMRVGNIIHAYARFDLGSTSTWDNRFGRISAPVTAKNSGSTSTQDNANIIQVEVGDASASLTYIMGGFLYDTGANFRISGWRAIDATAGSGIRSGYFLDLSNDVTLGDGDSITIKAIYMADD